MASWQLRGWKREGGLQAVSTGDRSYWHRTIAGEKENTYGEEEKGDGWRLEARRKGYLKSINEAIE